MFVLRYGREPPSVLLSTNATHSEAIATVEGSTDDKGKLVGDITFSFDNDQIGFSALNQSYDPTVVISSSNENSNFLTPQFDVDEFLLPGVADEPGVLETFDTTPSPLSKSQQLRSPKNGQFDEPMTDIVSSLQKQVTSLEKLISIKASDEKNQISNLQAKVAQLEQTLFQSSERERQLEATLGVIFDAFQATGAPQAQPNKALWNLVMSHSSQAISSTTGCSGQVNDGQQTKFRSLTMTPVSAPPVSTPGSREKAYVYADSAYGSMR